MNISALSIRNPIPVILMFLLAIMLGLKSFGNMKIQNFPDLSLPQISVVATLDGASPQQLETEVAKKIENSIAPLAGLKNLNTVIKDGSVSIMAEFELEKPTQEALDDVRNAVSSIRSQLPVDLNDPIINKVSMASTPIVTYAINSNIMNESDLSWFVDNNITKGLMGLKGVGEVTRVGGVNREIQILINPIKLQSVNITVSDLSRQLKNIQLETSAGKMEIGESEQPIRAIATVKYAKELENIELLNNNGQKILLSDIAEIKDTFADRRSSAWLNGKQVVGFEIKKTKEAGEVETFEKVEKYIKQLKQAHPDLEIVESFNFVEPVEENYQTSMNLLYEGAFLAVVIVFIFLRDIRATLISALALPLSIIPSFWLMDAFDFTLNGITLLALSLVIGVLVDDAIVEVENIARHMKNGANPYDSAIKATEEIGLAVVATTATLIAVFLPTAFMDGVPGLVFKHFGWTAALSIFASLVVARMLTPILAAYFMKKSSLDEHKEPFWMNAYLKTVYWTIQNKFKTILFAIIFFVSSVALIPLLPTGFFPMDNSSQSQVLLEFEPGITLSKVETQVRKAEDILKKLPEVVNIYSTIGAGSVDAVPGMQSSGAVNEVRKATLTLKLVESSKRPKKQIIENNIRELMTAIPGAKVQVGYGGNGEKHIISLVGEDSYALELATRNIEKEARTIKGIGNISSSLNLSRSEILIKINHDLASDFGVNTNVIADTIRVATQGDFPNNLSKLNSSVRQIPIVMKLNSEFRENIENLKDLKIPTKNGLVSLSDIADVSFSNSSAVITRYNRSQNLTIDIETNGMQLSEVIDKVNALPSMKNLPAGVSVPSVGEAERMNELFLGFGIAIITGIICIYVILVLLFKDFFQPITILMSLPLSLGGAFIGLLAANSAFSLPSLIGLIMLMGIATKNSILLVDYAIMASKNGQDIISALMDACHKRARPIIMTTIAMGAGMLPVALELGNVDNSFRAPMAIAVIGGLITSTFLSLLIIPSVYLYISNFQNWLKSKF